MCRAALRKSIALHGIRKNKTVGVAENRLLQVGGHSPIYNIQKDNLSLFLLEIFGIFGDQAKLQCCMIDIVKMRADYIFPLFSIHSSYLSLVIVY